MLACVAALLGACAAQTLSPMTPTPTGTLPCSTWTTQTTCVAHYTDGMTERCQWDSSTYTCSGYSLDSAVISLLAVMMIVTALIFCAVVTGCIVCCCCMGAAAASSQRTEHVIIQHGGAPPHYAGTTTTTYQNGVYAQQSSYSYPPSAPAQPCVGVPVAQQEYKPTPL
eukprot:TRINITY_DN428_c1_g1_i1.p3 TRINITY_DN428_c1_g1~~TRINITY_DN428_c1_g1_i1.p3  ORF type:complete len:194 (+),score=48.63 TRINITY_DN428_c1_g1_i1:81-584(+)